MKINPKVKALIESLGLELRISNTPEEAHIYGVKFKTSLPIAFYMNGSGVIWFNQSQKELNNNEAQIAILHEIGHAVVDNYGLQISTKYNEVKANAIALGYAAILDLPVSKKLLKQFNRYTKTTRK